MEGENWNELWNDVLVYTEGVVMILVMIMEGIGLPHMIDTNIIFLHHVKGGEQSDES
jgi:hypothetical protein